MRTIHIDLIEKLIYAILAKNLAEMMKMSDGQIKKTEKIIKEIKEDLEMQQPPNARTNPAKEN